MKTYFTFGQAHAHAIAGKTFDKDCVVCIDAPTHEQARTIMFDTFGQQWSNQYDTKPDMSYYPRGIFTL